MVLRPFVLLAGLAIGAVALADDGWFRIGIGREGVSVGFGNRNFGIRLDFVDPSRCRGYEYYRFDRYGRYNDERLERCRPYDRSPRVDLYDRSRRIDSGRLSRRGTYF